MPWDEAPFVPEFDSDDRGASGVDVSLLECCDWKLSRARRGEGGGKGEEEVSSRLGAEALGLDIILLRRSILDSRERALPLKLRFWCMAEWEESVGDTA